MNYTSNTEQGLVFKGKNGLAIKSNKKLDCFANSSQTEVSVQ